MSNTNQVTSQNVARNLSDLRLVQTEGSVVCDGSGQFTELDFPIFTLDDNTFPGSPCPTVNLIPSESLHEELKEGKIDFNLINKESEELANFNLDPILESSVDIQQLLNASCQVNDEALEKLILGVKTSDIDPVSTHVSTEYTAIPSTVINLNDLDFMSDNNTSLKDLTGGWVLPSVKTEAVQSCIPDSQSLVTSSTITPPASPTNSEYSVGRPGRKPSAGGPIRTNKKRQPEKGTEEYFDKRAKNNVAVRKSRDKAKLKQKETEERVTQLTEENENLQKKLDLLSKELNVLKGLFINVGASLPANFEKLLAK